jgi:hypothetical protein
VADTGDMLLREVRPVDNDDPTLLRDTDRQGELMQLVPETARQLHDGRCCASPRGALA